MLPVTKDFVLQPHVRYALKERYNALREEARGDLASPALALLMARIDELEQLAGRLGSTFYRCEECPRWHLRAMTVRTD